MLERALAGDRVALTGPGVLEIAYGLAADRATAPGLAWFSRLATSDLVTVLPLDATASIVAGRVRAIQRTPPAGGRRRGSKAEHRAGWVLDIQIAACAWAHGYAIATENRRDFDVIRDAIGTLYPVVPALSVVDPPTL